MKTNPENTRLIREALMKNPRGLNVLQVAEKTGINRMSAGRYLDVMAVQGLVDIQKVGNAKVYFLSKRIPVTTYMEYTSKHYCITDSSLHVVQLNKWIPKTVGMPEEDFIGRSLPDTLNGVVVNVDECREAMVKAVAGEAGTVIVEEKFKGTHKFFEILHMPVQFPDGSHGMMAISQDITENKKREMALRVEGEMYRDLVEHLPDIVFATDAGSLITYISPRIAELGLVPDKLYGRPLSDLAVPEDKTRVMAGLDTALREGTARGIRFRLRAGKEKVVFIEADCVTRRAASGMCARINGMLREIPVKASGSRKISPGK